MVRYLIVQTIRVVTSLKSDKCPCWFLSMSPHHKGHGDVTAEVIAELGWSCIRKKGVLKSRGWLRAGC